MRGQSATVRPMLKRRYLLAALACLLGAAVAVAGAFLYRSYRSWRDSPLLRTEYKVEPRQEAALPAPESSRPGTSRPNPFHKLHPGQPAKDEPARQTALTAAGTGDMPSEAGRANAPLAAGTAPGDGTASGAVSGTGSGADEASSGRGDAPAKPIAGKADAAGGSGSGRHAPLPAQDAPRHPQAAQGPAQTPAPRSGQGSAQDPALAPAHGQGTVQGGKHSTPSQATPDPVAAGKPASPGTASAVSGTGAAVFACTSGAASRTGAAGTGVTTSSAAGAGAAGLGSGLTGAVSVGLWKSTCIWEGTVLGLIG